MKRTITLLTAALTLTAGAVLAQPTITGNNNPAHGDSYTFFFSDTSNVIPGGGGAGMTWDLTGLTVTSSLTGAYISCPGGPGCASFPGSTLVLSMSDGTKEYYRADNMVYANTGSDSGTLQVAYTDPEEIVQYPSAFSSAHSDDFEGSYQDGTQGYIRDGNVNVQADGWGTLMLPTGTFTNVLRIHYTETFSDSAIGQPGLFNYISDNYLWLSPTHRGPLASIKIRSAGGAPAVTSAYYTNQVPTGIEDITGQQQDGILLYPNPVANESRLYLSIVSPSRTAAVITVADINGRITPVQEITQFGNNYILNVENLPKGLYIVRIENGTQVVSRKIERL